MTVYICIEILHSTLLICTILCFYVSLKRGNKLTVLIIHTLPTYHKYFVDKRSRHSIICVVMVGKKEEI